MGIAIEIGEKAPKISAKCYYPQEDKIGQFDLEKMKGKWVILTFYPGDFTFVCATDVEAFTSINSEFKKNNAEVYAISTDSIFSHKQWASSSPKVKESKIPLIEDFRKQISIEYGFLNRSSGAARRGTVIIDPEGRVEYISMHNDDLGKDAEHIFNAFMGLKYISEHKGEGSMACKIPANWKPGSKPLIIDTEKDIGKI